MKNRLQTLWNQVSLGGGPCPRPDHKRVRRLVDAALDKNPRAFHPWQTLRLAAVCAAALALLTGAAAGIGVLAPPTYNVLTAFFQGDAAPWEELMDFQPVSVSDDSYTLTLTSTVADSSTLFYTFTVEAHSDEAWEALQAQMAESFHDLFSFRFHGSLSIGDGEVDPESRTLRLAVDTSRKWVASAAVRLNLMDKGKWLSFSYRPVSGLRLTIEAEGLGRTNSHAASPAQGTVTLNRLTLSPLTLEAEYTAENTGRLFPVLYFLWKDGSVSPVEELLTASGSGHGSGQDGGMWTFTQSYQFTAVQNLSQLEAVVFGGMAYPLDGGEPYEVDVSALPQRGTDS